MHKVHLKPGNNSNRFTEEIEVLYTVAFLRGAGGGTLPGGGKKTIL